MKTSAIPAAPHAGFVAMIIGAVSLTHAVSGARPQRFGWFEANQQEDNSLLARLNRSRVSDLGRWSQIA
jgi:hypothetical protein